MWQRWRGTIEGEKSSASRRGYDIAFTRCPLSLLHWACPAAARVAPRACGRGGVRGPGGARLAVRRADGEVAVGGAVHVVECAGDQELHRSDRNPAQPGGGAGSLGTLTLIYPTPKGARAAAQRAPCTALWRQRCVRRHNTFCSMGGRRHAGPRGHGAPRAPRAPRVGDLQLDVVGVGANKGVLESGAAHGALHGVPAAPRRRPSDRLTREVAGADSAEVQARTVAARALGRACRAECNSLSALAWLLVS